MNNMTQEDGSRGTPGETNKVSTSPGYQKGFPQYCGVTACQSWLEKRKKKKRYNIARKLIETLRNIPDTAEQFSCFSEQTYEDGLFLRKKKKKRQF